MSTIFTDKPSHYQVLSLARDKHAGEKPDPVELKRAYHRSLLLSHPDKGKPPTSSTTPIYTLDQIRAAYSTLSNISLKASYDAWLLSPNRTTITSTSSSNINAAQIGMVETVDLDDMNYNEDTSTFSRSCRCGAEDGFRLRESQMEEHESEMEAEFGKEGMHLLGGSRSMIVGCHGCSLFVEVEWEVVLDELN